MNNVGCIFVRNCVQILKFNVAAERQLGLVGKSRGTTYENFLNVVTLWPVHAYHIWSRSLDVCQQIAFLDPQSDYKNWKYAWKHKVPLFLIRFSVLQNVLCRCQIWQCEFCEEQNVVDILAEEIPTEADVTYMISPAPATTATSCLGDENSMVVFCIDVSGSMGGHVSCFLSSFLVFSAKKCKPLEARCNTKLKKCPYIVDCWWENVCNENFYIF